MCFSEEAKITRFLYLLKGCCMSIKGISLSLPMQINETLLYHAIEYTANQNTGNLLYIRRYYNQPSHHTPRVYRIDMLSTVFTRSPNGSSQ